MSETIIKTFPRKWLQHFIVLWAVRHVCSVSVHQAADSIYTQSLSAYGYFRWWFLCRILGVVVRLSGNAFNLILLPAKSVDSLYTAAAAIFLL